MAVNQTSLKQLIQEMNDPGIEVMEGIVISTDPLRIRMTGDEKLTIGEANTYISKHLTRYDANCYLTDDEETPIDTIIIDNSLVEEDMVHILSLNHGKKYFILDRV